MYKSMISSLVTILLTLSFGTFANAACTVAGNTATPFQAGPPNPANGFSEYLTDSNGLSLELCLDGTGFCFFDPVDPSSVFSQQIGFGFEGFWWLAQPDTKNFPPNVKATLTLGAEAAFLGEIVDGGQFPFTRLRIRLDVPVAGTYVVTEPYGEHVYTITALGAGDEVFDSFDVQFNPGSIDNTTGVVTDATTSTNCVAPWLTWDTFPTDPILDTVGGDGIPEYIGDGGTPHLITGSPTGNNLFRIEAFLDPGKNIPLNTFDPTDADGNGKQNSLETNLFKVNGKIYDGRLGTHLVANRATYSRNASGTIRQVDAFASGASTALVNLGGGPNVFGPNPLNSDVNQFFISHLLTPNASVLPATVSIDATDGGAAVPTDPTQLLRPLVDLVTITRAEFDVGVVPPKLTVEAQSSDTLFPPQLTLALNNTPLVSGIVEITTAANGNPLSPPGRVEVVSSAGGSDTRLVEVVNSDLDNDGVPNSIDNCILIANANQRDTNSDGYGNICDPDLNDDLSISLADFFALSNVFGQTPPGTGTMTDHADFNGDGGVSLADFFILSNFFGKTPGPSGFYP